MVDNERNDDVLFVESIVVVPLWTFDVIYFSLQRIMSLLCPALFVADNDVDVVDVVAPIYFIKQSRVNEGEGEC